MFQNVLMTALTPLCDTNETHQWQNRPFTHNWPEPKHPKPKGDHFVTKTIKKRNKRNRTSYTTEQLRVLERTFSKTKYINTEHRKELAESLKIGEKCIKVWFQNRRMKEKRESSESSCDSSSECYIESITPPPVNNTTPSEEQYIPNYYIGVQNIETDSYYQPYVENVKGFSQINAYYQNYGTTSNTNPNMHMFNNSEYFRNDQNIYPTYYYPCTEPENTYTDGYQSQYHKEEEQNWSANAFDLNFL